MAPLPLVLKGIQTAEDALLAVEHGAAAIVVSNHGGRQLDARRADPDAAPRIVEAVDGRIEVSSTAASAAAPTWSRRSRSARAPCSPAARRSGVSPTVGRRAPAVLELLREEIELALALCGCASPEEVYRSAPH